MIDLTNLLIDIEDQRHYNSCVGQSLSTYLEMVWKKFDSSAQEFSPAFIWLVTKKEQGKDGNVGVNPSVALSVLKKYGCCLEKTFPYTDENIASYPNEAAFAEAKKHRIGGSRLLTYDLLKPTLDKGLPVSCLMDFGGGHQVILAGYRDNQWLIVNSWSIDWMDQGKQWMDDAEFKQRFKFGFVITGLKWQFLKSAKKWFRRMFK